MNQTVRSAGQNGGSLMPTAATVGGWIDTSTLWVSPLGGGVLSVSLLGRVSMVRSAMVDIIARELGIWRDHIVVTNVVG